MKSSKTLNPGRDFSISVVYKGFDNPSVLIEKGNKDSPSTFTLF